MGKGEHAVNHNDIFYFSRLEFLITFIKDKQRNVLTADTYLQHITVQLHFSFVVTHTFENIVTQLILCTMYNPKYKII